MIMPARLWTSQQVVCDRASLMVLYLYALLISWVLSIWLISPVFVSWYHGFGFISIFFGLIRVMLFVELLLIRRLSNSIGTEWALATFYVFFFSCRWRFSNWLMQLKQCSRCFQYTFFSHLQGLGYCCMHNFTGMKCLHISALKDVVIISSLYWIAN